MSNYSNDLDALAEQVGEITSDVACVDDSEPIRVVDRTITMPTNCVYAICCDANSQLLTFQVPRYADGIDLSSKIASIKFVNAVGGSDRATPRAIGTDDSTITLAWLLDGNVTIADGTVKFQIEFYDISEDKVFYSWQTKPSTFEVLPTLNVDGNIEESNPTWIQAVTVSLAALKSKVNNLTDLVNSLTENGVTPEQIEQAVAAYLSENPIKETDPNVYAWAKQPSKPNYTADEVGAAHKLDVGNVKDLEVGLNIVEAINILNTNKAEKDSTYTKEDVDSLIEKLPSSGGSSEIYIGTEEPTDSSIVLWINPEANPGVPAIEDGNEVEY